MMTFCPDQVRPLSATTSGYHLICNSPEFHLWWCTRQDGKSAWLTIVPEGQPIIAHQFIGGSMSQHAQKSHRDDGSPCSCVRAAIAMSESAYSCKIPTAWTSSQAVSASFRRLILRTAPCNTVPPCTENLSAVPTGLCALGGSCTHQ